MNNSYIVIAQRKTIDELKKIVTEDSKLNATYNELKEGNLLQPNCDVPPYLTLMTDSLNSQQEEISELKAVLQEEEGVKTLLSSIATELTKVWERSAYNQGIFLPWQIVAKFILHLCIYCIYSNPLSIGYLGWRQVA